MFKYITAFIIILTMSASAMAHDKCPEIGDPVMLRNGLQNGTLTYSAEAHFLCEQTKALQKHQEATYYQTWGAYWNRMNFGASRRDIRHRSQLRRLKSKGRQSPRQRRTREAPYQPLWVD